jgi:hypothetical protein
MELALILGHAACLPPGNNGHKWKSAPLTCLGASSKSLLYCVYITNTKQVIIQRWNDPLSALPGPWISRVTDIILKYHWLIGNRAKYVHSLHEKYGQLEDWPLKQAMH